jgi:Skp family chaperone for outer membrane proteins
MKKYVVSLLLLLLLNACGTAPAWLATRQVDETDKRIKELDNSLSIALEVNDKFQRENKKLADKVREVEGETSLVKAVGMNSPEMRALEKENADLKWDNKSLAKQVDDKLEEIKALKIKLEFA